MLLRDKNAVINRRRHLGDGGTIGAQSPLPLHATVDKRDH